MITGIVYATCSLPFFKYAVRLLYFKIYTISIKKLLNFFDEMFKNYDTIYITENKALFMKREDFGK